MKILIVSPYFSPAFYYGGPVRVTYEIARRLVQSGHDVTVATTDALDERSRYEQETSTVDGVKIHYFKNVSNTLACRYHAFLPIGLYSFLRNSSGEFDVVHVHEYYTLLTVFVVKFAQKHGVPILLSAHGSMPIDKARGNRRRKNIFNRIFRKTIMGNVTTVVALNEKEKQNFVDAGVERDGIEIIPNGIDICEFEKLPARMEFRKKYGITNDDRVILFVGRIHQIKGLDLLLKVFKELTYKVMDIKLVLVGPDDSYMRPIERMASESGISSNVIFTGLLSGNEKLSAYSGADIFVLPSRSEGFPVTVLEACASGLPVIVSEECNFHDAETSGAGLEIASNTHSLHDAIMKLLNNSELRLRMGASGKQLVRNNYDWNAVVKMVERAYQNAVNFL